MTICPFMSRPVVGLHDTKLRPVDCQREKCAAWGLVRERFKRGEQPGDLCRLEYKYSEGCRLIGGEVPG
jgi:hypothetical protein